MMTPITLFLALTIALPFTRTGALMGKKDVWDDKWTRIASHLDASHASSSTTARFDAMEEPTADSSSFVDEIVDFLQNVPDDVFSRLSLSTMAIVRPKPRKVLRCNKSAGRVRNLTAHVRMGTYNVWNEDDGPQWKVVRSGKVATSVEDLDVIGMQEVRRRRVTDANYSDMFHDLCALLPEYEGVYLASEDIVEISSSPNGTGGNGKRTTTTQEGIAIFSRLPIVKIHSAYLHISSFTSDQNLRAAMCVEVQTGKAKRKNNRRRTELEAVTVCNSHFSYDESEGLRNAAALLLLVKSLRQSSPWREKRSSALLVLGDFNVITTTQDSPIVRLLESSLRSQDVFSRSQTPTYCNCKVPASSDCRFERRPDRVFFSRRYLGDRGEGGKRRRWWNVSEGEIRRGIEDGVCVS